ncbi:WbqC family protein [Ulvibacter sp.]|nr:WbqC family protein [Ulvibacter sp.]
MKIAIMQPYIFPYIGYFQLINAVDKFVIYDNIQYTKKGWINRNRILVNGSDQFISLPIKKDSAHLNVVDRSLADSWNLDKKTMLNRIKESYRKAPYFKETYELIDECLTNNDTNLFEFILQTIKCVMNHLSIETELIVSSNVSIDHELNGVEKVMAICKQEGADVYINPIGGIDLYSHAKFEENGLKLQFQKSKDITYKQFGNDFVPWLSIIDVVMFNSSQEISEFLNKYSIKS